jgi:hypothetical protein
MQNFDVNLDNCFRKKINLGKICMRYYKGEDCEECNVSSRLFKEGKAKNDESLTEDARNLYARSRIFVNAIDVRDEDKSHPVYIYIFPPKVYDDLLAQVKGQRQLDPNINIFHPVTGRNIVITRKGTGKLTSYSPIIDSSTSEILNKSLLEQLKAGDYSQLHNLDNVESYISRNYEHMRQFEVGPNVIRLCPPYDGHSIYKELKFHRFTVAQFYAFKDRDVTHETVPMAPLQGFGSTHSSQEKQTDFNPFDLPEGTFVPPSNSENADASNLLNKIKRELSVTDDIPF